MNQNLYILFAALVACILNLLLTPAIMWLSHQNRWFDPHDARKIHTGDISRLGGIGMFVAFLVAYVGAALLFFRDSPLSPWSGDFLVVIGAIIIMHVMGLIDDFRNLRALLKFMIQLGAALLVVAMGFYFKTIWLPIAPYGFDLGVIGPPLTVVWIVGISNAINLIDGVDGLAGGIGIIAACTCGIMYIVQGDIAGALVAFAMVGAIAGFLFYNFPPAKIFMGDSGSLFLGFTLAVLPVLDKGSDSSPIGLLGAITVLLIPIFDTFAAIIRRTKRRVSFFKPDRNHLHHKLMNLGFSTRQILAVVYVCSMMLGAVTTSTMFISRQSRFILMIVAWFVLFGLFVALHYLNARKIVLIENKAETRA